MIRIVKFGEPVLRTKGELITKFDDEALQTFIVDMIAAMYEASGVGLAAQQAGRALQLAVIDVADTGTERSSRMWIDGKEVDPAAHMPMVLINPEIELLGERETGTEGCLSFPDITADITRPERVRVQALDRIGQPFNFEADGLLARAVQHEYDHLQGVLFIDRMNSATKASLAGRLKRMQRAR